MPAHYTGLTLTGVTGPPGPQGPAGTSASTLVVTNVQGGTTYTLVIGDADKTIEFTSASAVTLTVPPNSSVPFSIGQVIELYQYGAGQVTVAPGGGVTIRSPGGRLKLASQYAGAYLRKRATDEWVFEGDISP